MKNSLLGLILFLSLSAAFAGPNSSGGPQGSENMISKAKLKAVLEAITDANDAVIAIELADGGLQYIATVRNGNCIQQYLYNVKAKKKSTTAIKFEATFVDMSSPPNCQ